MNSKNNNDIKRLYRSNNDRMFSGVCGGLGNYLSLDPTIIRLIFVLITIFTGIIPGIFAYFILILIIPYK